MKWYNEKRNECLDLSKVAYWKYTSREDINAYRETIKEIQKKDPMAWMQSPKENTQIEIYIGGNGPLVFNGKDADDLYKNLLSQKDVI